MLYSYKDDGYCLLVWS